MFPTSGAAASGTNLEAMTPQIVSANSGTNTTELTLVNITGKGILTSASIMGSSSAGTDYSGSLKIVIDGVTMLPLTVLTSGTKLATLVPMARFKKSLVITYQAGSTNGATATACYLLD